MRASLPLILVLLGCSGSDPGPLTEEQDSSATVDDTAVAKDDTSAPTDSVVAETSVVDSTAMTETSTADSMTTMETAADTAGLRRGQCVTNAHCASGECRANAPGGICACGAGKGCPSSDFSCNMMFGACVLDCKVDGDCIPGMRCTTSGCALKSCMSDGDCVATTVCRVLGSGTNKYCQRKLCPDGTGCPVGTTCMTSAEGKSCIEDSLKF
jgi:hypothetical protein